ncbi:MAG: helix-turn-helix domain-containing protein [Candidatus Hodarchaeales archaeon]|jgi:hypothetical protein
MARPTKYKKEYNEQAYELYLLGCTDKEVADFFEVSEVTINTWKKKHAGFLKSLRDGKLIADGKAAKGLHKRATGYNYTETTREDRNGELKIVKTVDKEQAPDAGAALSWLKNRQPDKWRDKKDVEHSGGLNITFTDDWIEDEETTK